MHIDPQHRLVDRLQRGDEQATLAAALLQTQPSVRKHGKILVPVGGSQPKTGFTGMTRTRCLDQPDLGPQGLTKA